MLRASGESLFQRTDGAQTTPEPDGAVDVGRQQATAAVVEYAHAVAGRDAARSGVVARAGTDVAVSRCVQGRLPNVEFMLSWLFGGDQLERKLSPSVPRRPGAIRRAAGSPAFRLRIRTCRTECRNLRARTAGTARRAAATFKRTECSRSSCSSVMPFRNGCSEASSVRIMSSSESRKQGSSKPMRSASRRNTSTLDLVSPGAAKRGPRELQIVMAVGEVEVGVLQERRGRQQNIGVVGGVGLELFEHHGEQVLAPHAFEHQVLIRRDRCRIRVVDHQRLHRRIGSAAVSALPSSDMLTMRASRPSGERELQLRHFEAGAIQLKRLAGGKLQAAADFAPGSDQRRQGGRSHGPPCRRARCVARRSSGGWRPAAWWHIRAPARRRLRGRFR